MLTKDHTIKIKGGRVGILLIHGLAGTPAEVRYVAGGLARLGHTVSCPQLAGHGTTEAELSASTWEDWYRTCEAALDDLRRECDTVLVGGLSTGALLGLMLAARRPTDVAGMLLYSPTLWLSGWSIPWYSRLFKLVRTKSFARLFSFSDRAPHGIKDERIRDFIMKAMCKGDSANAGLLNTPGAAMFEHRRLADAVRKVLGSIEQPAMILHPREDDMAGIDNAWYLQRRLAGRIEMTVLDDSYHMITIDRQRQLVVDRSAQFVADLAGEQAAVAAKAELQAKARTAAVASLAAVAA
jgi:carboxylesterase